jgi:hypothetical protein
VLSVSSFESATTRVRGYILFRDFERKKIKISTGTANEIEPRKFLNEMLAL